MVAALAHEAVGHGGACLVNGGEITLLSVIWFRCSPGGTLIDLAGPIAGLIGGLSGLALAALGPRSALRVRLFGLLLGSFGLFWFSAQMVSQTVSGMDDWQIAATWPMGLRVAAVTSGVVVYGSMVRLAWWLARSIGRGPSGWRRLLTPYAAGALGLVACASLRPNDGSALETVRAVGLAPLGYLWAVTRPSMANSTSGHIDRSWPWIISGLVGLVLYAIAFGRGLGRMA
jgi:hypothetical protein